jgi:excisionase family DNA binding protein
MQIERDPSKWCTLKEAAALIGRSERTIKRWIKDGRVRSVPEPGGRHRIYRPDLEPPGYLPDRH